MEAAVVLACEVQISPSMLFGLRRTKQEHGVKFTYMHLP